MKAEKRGGKAKNTRKLNTRCSICGAVSILLLMISQGMPPDFLDEMDEVLREAKKMKVGRGSDE